MSGNPHMDLIDDMFQTHIYIYIIFIQSTVGTGFRIYYI